MGSITYLTSAFNRWWETAKEDLHGYHTLLIIIVLVLLLGGGGWYGRGRRF
jgi:hypothetical protein